MNQLLIVNTTIVNEGLQLTANVLKEAGIDYKCGWLPLKGYMLGAKIYGTVVNGIIAFKNGVFFNEHNGQCLRFNK